MLLYGHVQREQMSVDIMISLDLIPTVRQWILLQLLSYTLLIITDKTHIFSTDYTNFSNHISIYMCFNIVIMILTISILNILVLQMEYIYMLHTNVSHEC